MQLNIKNDETYQLAAELAELTGETLTDTVCEADRASDRGERHANWHASPCSQGIASKPDGFVVHSPCVFARTVDVGPCASPHHWFLPALKRRGFHKGKLS